jgi:bifunctional non-homologous end joining protein LigD
MSLETYDKKRDFKSTSEPKPIKIKSKNKLRFVVQKHQASHLHYDFRLEIDGVLKSWAIPKGPSLNPKDKRLAVRVEDHPYEYIAFEGKIPEGNYGAGTVSIFDTGIYEPANHNQNEQQELLNELKDGHLKFQLNGNILKGEFDLIKLKNTEKNWLLIKQKDDYALNNFEIAQFSTTRK